MRKILITLVGLGIIAGAVYFGSKENTVVTNPPVQLEERVLVEKYVRENIKTLAPESAVLGGSWYVTDINIDITSKTGNVTYEDGHIQNKMTFSYSLDGDNVTVLRQKS